MSYQLLEEQDAVLLLPAGAPAASVIWLHGLGADGHDFVPIVPQLQLPPRSAIRFVFPHAPMRPVTLNQGMRMRAWYDIRQLSAGGSEDADGIIDSAVRISALIERERGLGVASERIVLAGFSQGGAMTLHVGLRHPGRLAGLLALSTYLPLRGRLAQESSLANRQVPILMCHGRFDPVLALQLGRASRDALLALGYAVEWREYDMQHGVSPEEIADIAGWLRARLV
jgi:phospholipase/carboxylesterase